jgi:hypothetical protein
VDVGNPQQMLGIYSGHWESMADVGYSWQMSGIHARHWEYTADVRNPCQMLGTHSRHWELTTDVGYSQQMSEIHSRYGILWYSQQTSAIHGRHWESTVDMGNSTADCRCEKLHSRRGEVYMDFRKSIQTYTSHQDVHTELAKSTSKSITPHPTPQLHIELPNFTHNSTDIQISLHNSSHFFFLFV